MPLFIQSHVIWGAPCLRPERWCWLVGSFYVLPLVPAASGRRMKLTGEMIIGGQSYRNRYSLEQTLDKITAAIGGRGGKNDMSVIIEVTHRSPGGKYTVYTFRRPLCPGSGFPCCCCPARRPALLRTLYLRQAFCCIPPLSYTRHKCAASAFCRTL